MQFIKRAAVVLSLVCVSFQAAAITALKLNNFQFSLGVGANIARSNSPDFVITPYETDQAMTNHVAGTPVWKLGVGYYFFADPFQNREFFNGLLAELNFYKSAEAVYGDVWQYQSPQFNNYSFDTQIQSSRLMLDLKPNLFNVHDVSFYPIVGAGIAWNSSAYNESVTDATIDQDSNLSLNSNNKSSFAYDLGAGLHININPQLGLSLEYLYTNLGTIALNAVPANNVNLSSPPKFKLSDQVLMASLTWRI